MFNHQNNKSLFNHLLKDYNNNKNHLLKGHNNNNNNNNHLHKKQFHKYKEIKTLLAKLKKKLKKMRMLC